MKFTYFRGLSLGLFLGSASVLFSIQAFDLLGSFPESFRNTIVAQFFTLLAAALALWGVSVQIRLGEQRTEDERLAKLDASRSSLPLVLDRISNECEYRVRSVLSGKSDFATLSKDGLSEFQLSVLKDCIQFSVGLEKQVLQKVLVVYQILLARWEDVKIARVRDVPDKDLWCDFDQYERFLAVLNWLELRAMTLALFDYSRGDQATISRDAMLNNIFRQMNFLAAEDDPFGGGLMLSNRKDFSGFLKAIQAEDRKFYFIDMIWESKL